MQNPSATQLACRPPAAGSADRVSNKKEHARQRVELVTYVRVRPIFHCLLEISPVSREHFLTRDVARLLLVRLSRAMMLREDGARLCLVRKPATNRSVLLRALLLATALRMYGLRAAHLLSLLPLLCQDPSSCGYLRQDPALGTSSLGTSSLGTCTRQRRDKVLVRQVVLRVVVQTTEVRGRSTETVRVRRRPAHRRRREHLCLGARFRPEVEAGAAQFRVEFHCAAALLAQPARRHLELHRLDRTRRQQPLCSRQQTALVALHVHLE
eukprot:scaffold99030_cov61-Phaeocystis_antarctica.AAC.4